MIKRFLMGAVSVFAMISMLGCSAEVAAPEQTEQTKDKVIRHFELDGKNKPRVWDETIKVKVDYTKVDGKLGTSKQAVMSVAAPSCTDDLQIWSDTYADGDLACVSGYGMLDILNAEFPDTTPMHGNVNSLANFRPTGESCTFHGWVYYDLWYWYFTEVGTFSTNQYTWDTNDNLMWADDVWCYPAP